MEIVTPQPTLPEFPLTYPQQGVWYLEKISPQRGIGNLAATLRINRVLDKAIMEQSVNLMLRRNEGFRIRIRETEDGQTSQYFAPYRPYRLDYFDFSESGEAALFDWDRAESTRPFTSFDDDLFYFALLKLDDQRSAMFGRVHHLIADAWSFVQLGNELIANYDLIAAGQADQLAENPSYRDYILSELQYLESERYQLDRTFWQEQFREPPMPTLLKNRLSERHGLAARRRSFTVPEKLSIKIRDYCQQNRTSIFALFFAALCIYINRIKDQDDLTIGTPVLNRTNAREKKTIGMFISTVPLRIRVDHNQTFAEFSKSLDQVWFSVLKHQKYPYDCLLRDVRDQHPEVDRLYEIGLSYQNAHLDRQGGTYDPDARWHFAGFQAESLFLHINDREQEHQLVLNYDYLTDMFLAREIDFIHDHLIRLLWHALDNPHRQLAKIHMLSEHETQKVIDHFNRTDADYPRAVTIGQLFATRVDQTPGAIALVTGARQFTYQQLDQMAEAIARRLREAGIGREMLVGLLLKPSVTMLAAILGVIKAGGAYLPIDPDYPVDRINYMLEDSQVKVVLAANLAVCPKGYSGQVIDASQEALQTLRALKAGQVLPRLSIINQADDLLYVIYTSGSTGRPKGAMIEHRNVVRLLFNDQNLFDFGPRDTWTLFHSYCFDFSVWEMYGALLYGGRLVVVPKPISRDTARFRRLLQDEAVTILNQTPAAFYNLADEISRQADHALHLRMVIFGGDALKPPLLRRFREIYPATRLINMYGITETTVHVTYLELSDNDLKSHVSNVGRPIPTMRAYILDSRLNPVPIGIPGELCVSGEGVGRGYLNNPDLTASRFIPNPFVPGEVLYRSGDLARFYPRGDIEYLGRLDHQVKIRGHRIELGEIEAAILGLGHIREVRVMTRDQENGSKQLIAYFVPTDSIDLQTMRQQLSARLPDYMVPPYLVAIDEMPLNSNGKIDRKRLPEPGQAVGHDTLYLAPQTPLQQMVADVFAQVLGLPAVGLYDHFFHLGGDSLSAVQAVASLGESVSFADLYAHPTVCDLAGFMAHHDLAGCRLGHLLRLGQPVHDHQLVAFPFAGGSAASFLKLAKSLDQTSPQLALYAVNLPEDRLDLVTLADTLAAEIDESLDGDLIFYSHCAGSALALATANRLAHRGRPVKNLIIGASLPPGKRSFDPWKFLNDRLILSFLHRIGLPSLSSEESPEYLASLLQNYRSDAASYFAWFKTLQAEPDAISRYQGPIHCIVGSRDPITWGATRLYRRWKAYSSSVDLQIIKGADHYFLSNQADELARRILNCL